jgi:hypothetical protein
MIPGKDGEAIILRTIRLFLCSRIIMSDLPTRWKGARHSTCFKQSESERRRIGGGMSVIRQYPNAGQIDEMHLALSPLLMGPGEHLFSGIDLPGLGFIPFRTVPGENATHFLLTKR